MNNVTVYEVSSVRPHDVYADLYTKTVHVSTLSVDEAQTVARKVHAATGAIPDIMASDREPTDHTTAEAIADKAARMKVAAKTNMWNRLAEDAARIRKANAEAEAAKAAFAAKKSA